MTTAEQMPELPPMSVIDTHTPTGYIIRGYKAADMHAYARAYAAQDVAKECEACAAACMSSIEGVGESTDWARGYTQAVRDIADGIRAVSGKP